MNFDPKTDIPDGNACDSFDPIPGWDACRKCGWDAWCHEEEARHAAMMLAAAEYERSPEYAMEPRETHRTDEFVGPLAWNEDGD